MTDGQTNARSMLIARAIAAVEVVPTLRKRAEENLSILADEEIIEIIERANDRRQRAQNWLDAN